MKKAKKQLNWTRKTDLTEIIDIMIKYCKRKKYE